MLAKSQLLLMLCALILPTYLFAQTGPGGVGNSSNQVLWLQPDNFSLTDGSSIDIWNDTSGNGNALRQPDATIRPNIVNDYVNGYDAVRFDIGNRRLRKTNFTNFPTTQITTFYINKTLDSGDGILSYNSTGTDNDYLLFNSGNLQYYRAGNTGLSIDANDGNWHMVNMSWVNTGNGVFSYLDGFLRRNVSHRNGTSITQGGSLALGAEQDAVDGSYAANQSHEGDFTEVIIFNQVINTAERIIIQNYLTAKYGLTLNNAVDFYQQDNAANGNFDHDVAGIGQASDGSSHTDSQGTGIVRINTPSTLSNGDYLFWGEETKDPTYNFSTETTNYREQLNSKWRVSKVGDLGTVSVNFDISAIDLTGKQSCQPLQLVVSNDSNFTSSTTYDLTVSGTSASASNVAFSDGDYFTLRYLDQIVWDGSAYFNGSGTLNAPDTSDSCLKLTVKAGSLALLNADAFVREVEVETGALFEVVDGLLLEVENGVNNNGTIQFSGEAQLIQNHTGPSLNTGSGILKMTQEGTSNLYNYNFWSSPVNRSGDWQVSYLETASGAVGFTTGYDANPSATPIELSSYWLYTFNDLLDNYAGWQQITPTTGLIPGIGYTMKGSGSGAPSGESYWFNGTANDGDITIPALAGNQILVGNPYPSAIGATQFIIDNDPITDGSLYFYEHFETNSSHVLADYQGGYATYNLLTSVEAPTPAAGGTSSKGAPKDSVAVGQGFFVKIANSGNIQFTNSQREFARESLSESTFYRSAQATTTDSRIKYKLQFKDASDNTMTIALGYDQNASPAYDRGYDSERFNTLSNQIYWTIPDKELCIQGLNNFDVSEEIPLGINISNTGDYTFKISETLNFPANESIYLKDNQNNTFYDITTTPVTLYLTDATDQAKFSIVYQTSETLSNADFNQNDIAVYYNISNDHLVLDGIEDLQAIKSLKIYNILGQAIQSFDSVTTQEVSMSVLSSGIYIAEIIEISGVKTTLKFVKQ